MNTEEEYTRRVAEELATIKAEAAAGKARDAERVKQAAEDKRARVRQAAEEQLAREAKLVAWCNATSEQLWEEWYAGVEAEAQ